MNGLILIDKPEGVTSHDVVVKIRRKLKLKAVGHAGTLDPMATGLMLILIGEGTKFSDSLLNQKKSYQMIIQLGTETDSLDRTGRIISQTVFSHITQETVFSIAKSMQGEFNWPIPIFSAKKVDGQPLYKKAFKGETLEDLPTKQMTFYGLTEFDYRQSDGEFSAEISCSKGAFIRTWAQQLGIKLHVGAHLSSLRRIQSGGYSIKEAIALENFFLDIDNNQNWSQKSYFKNLNQISSEYPAFTVTGKDLKLLRNGQVSYDLERRLVFEQKKCYRSGRSSVVKIYSPELKLLSLLEIKKGNGVKVKRTFQSFC